MVTIELPISKSIANRELILGYLSGASKPSLDSDVPDDVHILADAIYSEEVVWDMGHAGTAMRFATALASIGSVKHKLQGTKRMHQRPIGILVEALRELGAEIIYLENDGYPPLEILPVGTMGGRVEIDGSVSSQFISALLLIAPFTHTGIELYLKPPVTSRPYIDLTLDVLESFGVACSAEQYKISINNQSVRSHALSSERDWSAAAFFYGLVAQGHPESIYFPHLNMESAQGDRGLTHLFESLGVRSEAYLNGVRIARIDRDDHRYEADLTDQPDLAQAIAFTCAAIGKECRLTGLHTLRIKETDRITAIAESLQKVGCQVKSGEDWLEITGTVKVQKNAVFESYDDHRMAMAASIFTPALGTLRINEESVVSKSFPKFWEVLEGSGAFSLLRI